MRRAFRLGVGPSAARVTNEVDDELAFHFEMRIQQLISRGLSPDDAMREARRQFGDVASVRDACVTFDQERDRAMRRANLFDDVRQDFLFALRMLHRNAGVTAVIVLSLALGIGANTAIFTLVDAVVLRQLPVRDARRLVGIGDSKRVGGQSHGDQRTDILSYPLYADLRDQSAGLVTGLAATGRLPGGLSVRMAGSNDRPEHPAGRLVSANYFGVLGVTAARGHLFDGTEDRVPGAAPVVVISDRYWTRRFNRATDVVGRNISVNDIPFTIIGVTPPGFTGDIVGQSYDLWIPVSMHDALRPSERALTGRNVSWLLAIGRLAPGVTLEQARDGFTAIARRTMQAHAPTAADARGFETATVYFGSASRGFSAVRQQYSTPLYTLMVGVALLMVIICANVANLLLARAIARGREMGVRMAIGAGRSRLIRQMFTESLLVALLGALGGLAVAWLGSRMLLALVADGGNVIPVDPRLDLPVLAFTLGVTLLAVTFFGLVPALRGSRVDLATAMRVGSRALSGAGGTRGGNRFATARLLVSGQVGLSLVLLMGAAVLVHSLHNLQYSDTGLDRDHLLIVDVDARGRGYVGARLAALTHSLHDDIARIPGVQAAGYSENGIFSGSESRTDVAVPGFAARSAEDSSAFYDRVGPGYAQAIGARMLAGRDIEAHDEGNAPMVALINETMARHYFGGIAATGKTFRLDSIQATVVGIIADTKDHRLDAEPVSRFYLPYVHTTGDEVTRLRFEIRTTGDPALTGPAVRKIIAAADPSLQISDLSPLAELMSDSVSRERLLMRVATGFGVLALLLAAVGLYGIMTYAVTRRTGEIGLRVALGAQQSNVVRLMLGDALRLVGIGVVAGVPLAMASTRLLGNQLHGVTPTDPASLAVALVVLTGSATVAALLPALRAARIEPVVALRED